MANKKLRHIGKQVIKKSTTYLSYPLLLLNRLTLALPADVYILSYHEVYVNKPKHLTHMSVFTSLKHFEQHINFLAYRYEFIDLARLSGYLEGEKIDSPKILLTFDDGFSGIYHHAWPVLKQKKIPAVVFLITDILKHRLPFHWNLALNYIVSSEGEDRLRSKLKKRGIKPSNEEPLRRWAMKQFSPKTVEVIEADFRQNYERAFEHTFLSLSQIREMMAEDITFGLHTSKHPVMSFMSLDEQREEIKTSLKTFGQIIGREPVAYAHPYGHHEHFNDNTIKALDEYLPDKPIFSCYGKTNYGRLDRKDLRRIGIHDNSVNQLLWRLKKNSSR